MERLLAAATALMFAGCTPATLDVLDRAPAPDSGVVGADATLADGPGDGSRDSSGTDADAASAADAPEGGDATGPDGAPCSGLDLGASCTASSRCCSGYCGPGGGVGDVCLPTVGCAGQTATCAFAGACCSLACVQLDGGGAARSCGDGPACASAGAACSTGADCCTDSCTGGHCAPSSAMCKPAGEACGGNPECCGQQCSHGHCALAEGCRVHGEICGSSADCCTALCVLDAQSVGHCGTLPACTENDHKPCTRQAGEICGGNDDCCSRECVMQPGGVKRCLPGGGCRSTCELCASNADCCSGVCTGQDGAMGTCQPAPTCGADGETCGGNGDCCAGSTCIGPTPPSGVHRCLAPAGDGACRPDATGCARVRGADSHRSPMRPDSQDFASPAISVKRS